jgi:glycerophosphoryl diester phosphodiesterase
MKIIRVALLGGIVLLSCISLRPVTIVGHRGACGYEPENTLTSFAKAIECGADMIEFDVWKCLSGELVVFHDKTVDRITDGIGFVESKTLDELKQLSVLGRERIPTLAEVFDFVDRRVKLYIELKGSDIADDVVRMIEDYVFNKHWQYDDFLVAAFDHTQLQAVKSLNSAIAVAALISGIPVKLGSFASDVNAQIAVLDAELCTQRLVDDIHSRGILVYVYTVNNADEAARLVKYGVDGIVTDYPDYIRISFSKVFSKSFSK